MRRWIGIVAALGLLAATDAGAHVVPQPAYLTPGQKTTVTLAAPNERRPHVLVGLTLTAPPGIELGRATPPPGWKLGTTRRTADWSLGAVARRPEPDEQFQVVASTTLAPGAVAMHAVQRYDDGGLVRWTLSFTILPAASPTPKEHLLPAIVTAILGVVVIALLLLRMRGRRQPGPQPD